MRHLSGFLDGSPLVIGSKSRDQALADGVTYFRYGIPSINPGTLRDCFIEGVPPLVHAAPGGLYINIDSERLKSIRTANNISLGELAAGGTDASIDVVLRLEEILNAELVCPIKILSTERDLTKQDHTPELSEPPEQNEVSLLLTPLGFFVFPAKQAPFSAISNDSGDNTMLTGFSMYNRTMVRNARLMSSISSVAGTKSVYIVKGECRHTQIDGTVLIEESEFRRIDDLDDVMRLIQERNIDKGEGDTT
jgi:putative transcriptional regulator